MSKLTETLKRWPADINSVQPGELTVAECSDLVTTKITEPDCHIILDDDDDTRWLVHNDWREHCRGNHPGPLPVPRTPPPNPMEDANDMIEAVRAFAEGYPLKYHALYTITMCQLRGRMADSKSRIYGTEILDLWLHPLPDICLAMLQALAESGGTDDD